MSVREQGGMRKSIDQNQRTNQSNHSDIPMFKHGMRSFFGVSSICPHQSQGYILQHNVAWGLPVVFSDPSFLPILKGASDQARAHLRRRSRSQPNQFSAEVHVARSAFLVYEALPNSVRKVAALNVTTQVSEQRRCFAA